MTEQHKEVIIVGGGLVGGLTALLLSQAGVQVTVLDAAAVLDAQQVIAQPNPRVLALSQATIHLLKTVDVWSKIERLMPYSGMQVWNRDGYGEILFGQASAERPLDDESLGYMVEPSILNLAIQAKMLTEVADYRTQVRVKSIEQTPQGWRVQMADGQWLSTTLLIGADGANSFVRTQALIDLDVLDYQQAGLTCAIQTEHPHQHVARQVFLHTGPLAFLPMASIHTAEDVDGSETSKNAKNLKDAKNAEDTDDAKKLNHAGDTGHWQSIVWTLPQDYAEEYAALDDEQFCRLLSAESQLMLGQVQAATTRVQFPLKARAAQRYVKSGLALIGDAAHVIHPLAGQGVNIGCLDAAVLCDALLHDRERGVWAHEQTLKRYEHRRMGQNQAMMHSMSAIGWIEKQPFFPLVWAQNFGLKQVEQHRFLKDAFMLGANGLQALKQTRYARNEMS